MRTNILMSVIIFIVLLLFCCHPAKAQDKTGRFQIYYSPIVRADTFLLDTQTGKVWQMVKDKDDNSLWQLMKKE